MASKTKIDFVKKNWPLAKTAFLKYGINPVAILAKQVKESGWQPHKGAQLRKNYFGLTATKYSKPTPHWQGKSSKSNASGLLYRVYTTVQDNFLDYAWVIKTKYPEAAAAGSDIKAFVEALAKKYTGSKNAAEIEAYKLELRGFALQIESIAKSLGYLTV